MNSLLLAVLTFVNTVASYMMIGLMPPRPVGFCRSVMRPCLVRVINSGINCYCRANNDREREKIAMEMVT